jgi:hypothetical protein
LQDFWFLEMGYTILGVGDRRTDSLVTERENVTPLTQESTNGFGSEPVQSSSYLSISFSIFEVSALKEISPPKLHMHFLRTSSEKYFQPAFP